MSLKKQICVIGLTGSIGSGKTTVGKIFEKNNYEYISADKIVAELYSKGKEGYKQLKLLNLDIYKIDLDIDKSKLRKLIFENKNIKKNIEKIIHPLVIEKIKRIIENKDKYICKAGVIIEVPLLFETNIQNLFDTIITVIQNENIHIARASERDKTKKTEIETILNQQLSAREKARMSDYEIKNNGTIKDLEDKVSKLIEEL